jgi:hypothetical protein
MSSCPNTRVEESHANPRRLEGAGDLAEGAERCKKRLVSKSKDEPAGSLLPLPLQFLAAWLAVCLGRVLQQEVDYLMAENRVLRERLGNKRLRLTIAERRRLAVLGEQMGRKALAKVATIARPEKVLRWYRELVAKKYDGSKKRCQGGPGSAARSWSWW